MLKPKKRKNGVVILSPRICVAVGKKLIVQDGQWVSDGFSKYSSLTMCAEMRKIHGKRGRDRRSQMPKVIRTVAGWYMRFMKKNFPQSTAEVDIASFVRNEPTAMGGELPMRTGTAYVALTNRPGSKPTPPEIERILRSERHTVKSAPNENGVHLETVFTKWEEGGYGVFSRWVDDQGRPTNSKGELLNLPEIKGVQLKSSGNIDGIPAKLIDTLDDETMASIVKEFGTVQEQALLDSLNSETASEYSPEKAQDVLAIIVKRFVEKELKVTLPHSKVDVKLRSPTMEDMDNLRDALQERDGGK
ncbi:hypothetical protein ASESINO_150 [Erwinia phage vB_EamM_Asesino]|uniref:Uncharacterized protein n=1 Tax=Erwinia phage vB_EamM_Asesino TaxID=1883370 RepID=A0A1B2IA60_9CAUD|nr:hypothetical protein ASESINO_150 [Erwinia phage vB_EamM_Asesino]ANZ48163.1 hypothetical protein ASESINO_150 [Erwinia phage vB_EamM_Asesino]